MGLPVDWILFCSVITTRQEYGRQRNSIPSAFSTSSMRLLPIVNQKSMAGSDKASSDVYRAYSFVAIRLWPLSRPGAIENSAAPAGNETRAP